MFYKNKLNTILAKAKATENQKKHAYLKTLILKKTIAKLFSNIKMMFLNPV